MHPLLVSSVALNLVVRRLDPLIPPNLLRSEIPLSDESARAVLEAREEAVSIVNNTDAKQRLLVIAGPCSIHDRDAALEYCDSLMTLKERYKDDLLIIMRSCLEKPRTAVAWKGIINDPDIDNSFKINKGLRLARQLCTDLTAKGMPISGEILDTISSPYLKDLLSVGEIGSTTTESDLHRSLASGMGFPVGFRNGTDGALGIAIDAIHTAQHQNCFLSTSDAGINTIVDTRGNEDCFIILSGYYDVESVDEAKQALEKRGLQPRLMLDCSHESSPDYAMSQSKLAASRISSGDCGIMGVLIKSNINEGNQELPKESKGSLLYGVSITDVCIGWENTEIVFETLAKASKQSTPKR
ncbi:Phe-inhibited DAHP synthase AroG [Stipitochalara longipes BDJ]|nr:Phe-inhibited DAHP synthase AroG [Stipitochalara longipes BDJ]